MKKILFGLLMLISFTALGQRLMEEVPTIADLKARLPGSINKSVFVRGYYTPDDGGGGTFIVTNSFINVDNGLKIQSTAGPTFSYLRQFSGPVNPKWFGCVGDGITDDTARLQETVTQSTSKGYAVNIPRTRFRTTAQINVPSNAQIFGEGSSSVIYGTFSGIVLNVVGVTNVTVRGVHTDGAYSQGIYVAGGDDNTFDHIEISGATVPGTITAGLNIDAAPGVRVLYPYFHDNGVNSTNQIADYNIVVNPSSVPSHNLLIQSPKIINANSKYGVAIFCETDARVVDAFVDMGNKGGPQGVNGYGLMSYGNVGNSSQRVSFIGGTVTNTYGTAIYVNNNVDSEVIGVHISNVASTQPDTGLAVSGIGINASALIRVIGNSVTNSGINSSITLANTTNCVVSDNNLSRPGPHKWGVWLRGYNYGTSIKGNTIFLADRGIGTALDSSDWYEACDLEGNVILNPLFGIITSPPSSNNIIRANRIYSSVNYGLLDQATATTVDHNVLMGGVNYGLQLAGTNGIVKGNFVSGHNVGVNVVGPGYRFDTFNRIDNNTTAIADAGGALVGTITSGQNPAVRDTLTYYLQYVSPTTITNFSNALPGAIRRFVALNTNATIAVSSTLILDGAGNFQMKSGDSLILTLDANGVWHQTGKSLNSNWLWYDRTNERSWFGSPAIVFTSPSTVTFPWDVVLSTLSSNALMFRVGAIGAQNAFSISVDSTTNYVHAFNGVAYKLPYTQGAAGSLWANDGSGNVTWQQPANIFNFGNQFTASGTNINLAIGLATTNQAFYGDTTAPAINLGSINGTVDLNASSSPEFTALLSGNSTINITNVSDFHNFNVLATNTGNFSLSFTFNGATNLFYWNKNGNSTPETNDFGAGLIGEFNFWKIPGRIKAAYTGLGQIGGGGSSGANPTALLGLTPINGASAFFMRSDAAPALDQSISPTWTSPHIFQGNLNNVLKPITLSNTNTSPNNNTAVAAAFDLVDDSAVSYEAGSFRVGKLADWPGAGSANSFASINVLSAGVPVPVMTLGGSGGSSFTYPTSIGATDPFGAGKWFQFRQSDSATAGAQKYSPAVTWQGSGWNPTSANAVNVQVGAYVIPVQESANNPSIRFILESVTTNSAGGAPIFEVTSKSSTVLGERIGLQTNATDGFVYMPSGSGPPLGTPTAVIGKVAFYYDVTGDQVYYYNGGWKAFAQSAAGANWVGEGNGTNSDLNGNAFVNQIVATNGMKVGVAVYNNNSASMVNAGGTVTVLNNSSSRLSKLLLSGGNGAETSVDLKAGNRTSVSVTTNSALQTLFGLIINRFATATNYTLTVTNHYVASTATCTNTLPPAGFPSVAGQVIIVKNIAGTTTVRPAGADTIDGVAADDTLTSKAAHRYVSDGVSNWEIY